MHQSYGEQGVKGLCQTIGCRGTRARGGRSCRPAEGGKTVVHGQGLTAHLRVVVAPGRHRVPGIPRHDILPTPRNRVLQPLQRQRPVPANLRNIRRAQPHVSHGMAVLLRRPGCEPIVVEDQAVNVVVAEAVWTKKVVINQPVPQRCVSMIEKVLALPPTTARRYGQVTQK